MGRFWCQAHSFKIRRPYSGFVACRFLYAAVNLKRPGRWPARSISSCSSLNNRQSSGVCSSVPVNLIGQSSVLPRLAWRNRCNLMAARASRVVLLVRRRTSAFCSILVPSFLVLSNSCWARIERSPQPNLSNAWTIRLRWRARSLPSEEEFSETRCEASIATSRN